MKETERIVDVYESVIEQMGDILFIITHPVGILEKAKDGTLGEVLNKKENKKVFQKLKKIRKRYLTKDYRYVKRANL